MRIQRKITPSLLLVGLAVAGASLFSNSAYAQASNPTLDNGSFLGVPSPSNQNPVLPGVPSNSNATPSNSSAANSSGNNDSTFGNSLTAIGCLSGNIALCGASVGVSTVGAAVGDAVSSGVSTIGNDILVAVAVAVLAFANWLLGIAGVLFNLIMYYGVFQFGNTVGNSPGVLAAWGILRDLANMALLFGFIFMGIATILDTGAMQNFTAKRALPSLLIFAILMNFSLFTCEAMIDVSNALSATMYSQANTDPCTGDSVVGSATQALTGTSCGINYGLAGHIMQSTGLSGIWAIQGNSPLGAKAASYFGLALFATIGAIVFFAASIMLAIRVVILTLLVVVSPMGFAGMAIPPLRKLAGDWWTRVIHQAFYAPIMLLLILISLKIADSFTSGVNAGANNGLAAAVLGQDASVMGVFLVFMLVIGFMVASLIAANRFGAVGATAAVGFGKKVVLGTYGGAAGFAGRHSIGRASNWAQKNYKSNTTLRRIGVISRLDSGIIKATDAGKNATFGSKKSFTSMDKEKKDRQHTLEHLNTLDDAKNADTTDKMSSALKRIGESDLPDLVKELKGNEEKLKLISESLSAEKFEKLMNNKEFNDEHTKKIMKDLRYSDLASAVTEAETASNAYISNTKDPALKKANDDAQKRLGEEIRQLGGKDAIFLGQSDHANLLNDGTFSAALSEDQLKAFRNNDNLTTVQKRNLEDSRTARLNDPAVVAAKVPNMKPDDLNKLKGDVLSNPKVLQQMNGRQLAKLDLDGITDPKHVDAIVAHVTDILTSTDPAKQEEANKFKMQIRAVPKYKQRWEAEGITGII